MTIQSFDSISEMLDFLAGADNAAVEAMKTHPIKVDDLQDGDYFVSIRSDIGIMIFGRVVGFVPRDPVDLYGYTDEEIAEIEAEDAEERKQMDLNRTRGYIFGKCHSMLCPDGELGDTHVTRIHHKIDRAAFERAKANGFRHMDGTN